MQFNSDPEVSIPIIWVHIHIFRNDRCGHRTIVQPTEYILSKTRLVRNILKSTKIFQEDIFF